jgi:precorrin-6Y C5,15-methyltransferase (decarboxylating)
MSLFSPESAGLSSAGPADGAPWLTLIGIGEDGRAGLCAAALAALDDAELVIGGARHLALAGPLSGETRAWPSPLSDAIPAILMERGRKVCVLASGDPLHYGVGVNLAAAMLPGAMRVFPHPSAFSLACARLGWAQQDCALVSLHGRPLEKIVLHLQPGARVLALSWDETTPGNLAMLLTERGFGTSAMTVLEALGGPRERIRGTLAADFALEGIVPLNLIAVEVAAGRDARILPLACGLDDDWFAHDGQISKADIRAITLSGLSPRAGELLWDIGAGSGSIGIEWCLRHPRNRAIAIEAKPERAARIAANATALGALPVTIVEGPAPAGLAGQPAPDAVFIGGGITEPGVFEAAWAALKPSGRLVANVVTLEGEARLAALFEAHGGTLRRIGVSHLDQVGTMHGWRSAMPVTQWRVGKP